MIQTYKHVGSSGYQQYNPDNLEEGRKHPAQLTTVMDMHETLSMIGEGEFAVGHTEYDPRFVQYLKKFKKILMLRDKAETLASMATYWEETGRPYNPPHAKHHRNVGAWKREDDVFVMDFHDLIDINIKRINQLQEYLFGEIQVDSSEAMQRALDKPSLTKAKARG